MKNDDHSDELSREEKEAFRSLARVQPYSPADEDRMVGELRGRGLVRSASLPVWRRFVQVAAVAAVLLVTFLFGVQYGSRFSEKTAPAIAPARETGLPHDEITLAGNFTEDPAILDDYRDEPDRPGNGGLIPAKRLER